MDGYYLALGDSISIDDYAGGPGRGAASLLHRNRDADFPGWAGRDLASRGLGALNLAEDGATAGDVLNRQLDRVTGRPAVATVTMGGNDLLLAYGDGAAAAAAVRTVAGVGEQVLALVGQLNRTLARLAERHGAVLADLHAAFAGHGVTAGDPAQPSPQPARRDLWYCGVVEPNAWGADAVRAAWWEALQR